jgi:hypothetical protein
MAKRKEDIRNVIVISDTHVGCQMALCHPDGAALDAGGFYDPSELQRKVYAIWDQFWSEWVPRVTHREPFAVVHNGDAIDGSHHNSTTQWSHNINDQVEHAVQLLTPVVEACEGRYYHIRGTEAHIGQSGVDEENLAKKLGAIPNETGNFARWELWKKIGPHLVHFSHHIGTTSSAAHETSAVNAELASCFNEAGRWGHAPPAVVVRSHRHRSCEVRLPAKWGYATGFVTPAWQLKTPFVFRIPGGRTSTPQIGGSIIRLGDEELHTRHFVVDIGRGRTE